MPGHLTLTAALALLLPLPVPAGQAQDFAPPPLPAELVLEGDNIMELMLGGERVRLQVSGDAFGPPVINPDLAARLALTAQLRHGWRFGPVRVDGSAAMTMADFGAGTVPMMLTWADRAVSDVADGIIGIHHLPHARVTFALRPPAAGESVQRFALKRSGGGNARLGTEVTVGKKQLVMIFVTERPDNLITAPTANFIATHQNGGFLPASGGVAVMNFGVVRPTRVMRIAEPITLGALAIDRFAVRVADYGDPSRVGEVSEDDPRFEKGHILVSRRKGRGKPDLLTRIGGDQIAHCSALTYDLARGEIRLSCAAKAD